MTSCRVNVEGSGAQVRGDEDMLRPRAEEPGSPSQPGDSVASRSAEDSGLHAPDDCSVSERELAANTSPSPPPASQAAHPNSRAAAIRLAAAGAGAKLGLASVVATLFGALYVESANDLYLGFASTALALVAYWLAEHELGLGGAR
jgi:hypothetical protein